MGNTQDKSFKDTWLGKRQPFKFLFVSAPSISHSEPRWALSQIMLSFVFFFAAIAVGFATIDITKVGGGTVMAIWVLLGLALLCFSYAVGLGIHWVKKDSRDGVRDDGLHDDIQTLAQEIADLVAEMRKDRNERNKTL